jgi:hypothetical protein
MAVDVHHVSGRCWWTQLTLSTLTAYKCLSPSCQVICRNAEKKFKVCSFSHNNMKFLPTIADVSLYLVNKDGVLTFILMPTLHVRILRLSSQNLLSLQLHYNLHTQSVPITPSNLSHVAQFITLPCTEAYFALSTVHRNAFLQFFQSGAHFFPHPLDMTTDTSPPV